MGRRGRPPKFYTKAPRGWIRVDKTQTSSGQGGHEHRATQRRTKADMASSTQGPIAPAWASNIFLHKIACAESNERQQKTRARNISRGPDKGSSYAAKRYTKTRSKASANKVWAKAVKKQIRLRGHRLHRPTQAKTTRHPGNRASVFFSFSGFSSCSSCIFVMAGVVLFTFTNPHGSIIPRGFNEICIFWWIKCLF